ncbi:MAG: peptidylprolyl isomerase, partial [Fidelibacterota bacterium]
RAEAVDLIAKLKKGADFAQLADEYTEDPGNQVTPDSSRGGYLGWFGHGQMVPAFEEAAFGGEPGDIVGPVMSNFGVHIIKIHNRKTENNEEKVEASHILLRIEISPRTRDKLRNAANLFSYDAQDYGFDAAVDTHQVAPRESMPFTEEAVSIGGLGPMRAAVRFAFNNEPGVVSDPFENDQFYAVVTLDSIIAPGPRPLEEVKPALVRTLSDQIVHEKALKIVREIRRQVDQGKSFREVAAADKKLEVAFGDSKNLVQGFRNVGRSNMLVGALLDAKPGDLIGPVKTIRGYALVEVVKVPGIDEKDFEVQKPTIRKRLLASRQNQTYSDWLEAQQKAAEIVDNRKFYY